MNTRRTILGAAALLAVASASLLGAPAVATAAEDKVQLMFVQTAADLKTDATTVRLVNVNPQAVYFSDRPVRIAGHLTMADYLKEWQASEGADNFAADPPNATLSVVEPGNEQSTLAVIEISHPVVDGNDLVYNYTLIEGVMPKTGGATALFIDWIGVGGGVGRGFHGVGVGRRGVGRF